MSFNIGVNVVEVDGRAAPSVQPAPTSVAAFIVRARRGVPGEVYRISNWTQFIDRFGSYMKDAYGAYAVRGFFNNGGSVAYITRVAKGGGATAAASATKTFNDGGGAALTVTAGYRGKEDPGAWGNGIAVRIAPNPEEAGTYDLFVRYNGRDVITWKKLNNSDAADAPGQHPETVINNGFTGSEYIKVSREATNNPATTDDTDDADEDGYVSLVGGADGGAPTTTEFTNALSLFDVHRVQLVCCPETDEPGWVRAALNYCENRGDCMFVGHTPENRDYSAAKTYGQSFQGSKVYGALYFPWILVNDPLGTEKYIPASGQVMGVIANTIEVRGIGKAPAGNAARVKDALDVKFHITDTDHTDLVKNGSVNAVRFIPGQGIVIDSSRTLSTDPRWFFVNIRLLFNYVKTSLLDVLRFYLQEPNDETLWNKIRYNSVEPFLTGLWNRGAFGPGAPEDVFEVKIDAENNPPENIQQGLLTVEVYFYPSRPAETIITIVGQQAGGATTSES